MHLPRFIVDATSEATIGIDAKALPAKVKLPLEEAHHASVLRCKVGDEVAVYDSARHIWFHGELSELSGDHASVNLTSQVPCSTEARQHLLVGLPSTENCELIVEKAVELGASSLGFFTAERSQTHLKPQQAEKKIERFKRIARAALKQSGSPCLPNIGIYADLDAAWASENVAGANTLRLLFLPPENAERGDAQVTDITTLISSPARPLENLAGDVDSYILIGPEGGLTSAEILWARNRAFRAVSLGRNTLRTETAAIVALALVQTLCRR